MDQTKLIPGARAELKAKQNGSAEPDPIEIKGRKKRPLKGLHFDRKLTKSGSNPYDTVEWEIRTALITGERGEKVFEQNDVEVPVGWSQLATNVVA